MSATTKRRLPRLPFHGRVAVIGLCTLALHVAAVRAATPAPVIAGIQISANEAGSGHTYEERKCRMHTQFSDSAFRFPPTRLSDIV